MAVAKKRRKRRVSRKSVKGLLKALHKEPTVPLTVDSISERGALVKAIVREHRQSVSRLYDDNDVDYMTCLIFQSLEQRAAFLESFPDIPTKHDGLYMDGQTLALKLNLPIPVNEIPPLQETKPIKELKTLALTEKDVIIPAPT
jgi:hypothetical protein